MINEFKPMSRKKQIEIIGLLSTISANANDCIHQITDYNSGYNSGVDIDHLSTDESEFLSEQMYLYIENRMHIIQKLINDVLLMSTGFEARGGKR